MRNVFSSSFFAVALLSVLATACSEGSPVGPDAGSNALIDGWAIQDNGSQIVGAHRSGRTVLIDRASASELLDSRSPQQRVVVTTPEQAQFVVWYSSNGRPTQAVFGDVTVAFGNWTSASVDLAVIGPDGTVQIFRDEPVSGVPAATFLASSSVDANSGTRVALRLAGNAIDVAACVISAKAGILLAAPTLGASLVVAGVSCGNSAFRIWNSWTLEDDDRLRASSDAVSNVVSLALCTGDVGACFGFIAGGALTVLENALLALEAVETEARAASGAVTSRAGSLQLTLTWENSADLDLSAQEPNGTVIDFRTPRSPTGGALDRDDLDGFGPENISWPANQVPSGPIRVRVTHYSGPSPARWTVLVQRGQESKIHTGTVSGGQTVLVTIVEPGRPLATAGQVIATVDRTMTPVLRIK